MFDSQLIQIKSTHNRLRTKIVEGLIYEWPRKGERFRIIADPIDRTKNARIVTTSVVQKIRYYPSGTIRFDTENSSYLLKRPNR